MEIMQAFPFDVTTRVFVLRGYHKKFPGIALYVVIITFVRKSPSVASAASRRFSRNVIAYLSFLKKHQICHCHLLQIIGGA